MANFSDDELDPSFLETWFPVDLQHQYIERFRGSCGLTRRQAQCFVRLWGYCQLKLTVQQAQQLAPLTHLERLRQSVSCTQQEASALFYDPQTDRGSPRSAGMMIERLVDKKLVRKEFDGNATDISIFTPSNFLEESVRPSPAQLVVDDFNLRTDAVRVGSLLVDVYRRMMSNPQAAAHGITQTLRLWGQQYSPMMRVMRCQDSGQIVGFYTLFPTHSESERIFFMPPSRSLYLGSIDRAKAEPVELAPIGDKTCYAIFIRAWHIDLRYWQPEAVAILLRDVQQTLIRMRQDFPNLFDLYAPNLYPGAEDLCRALGFQSTICDPNLSLCWMHLAVDHFLDNDKIEASVSHLF